MDGPTTLEVKLLGVESASIDDSNESSSTDPRSATAKTAAAPAVQQTDIALSDKLVLQVTLEPQGEPSSATPQNSANTSARAITREGKKRWSLRNGTKYRPLLKRLLY